MTQALIAPPPLAFRRTVDRGTVHRAAVSEVFVTEVRPLTDRSALVGVQLPQSHSYYSDHTQTLELADLLLVLEACRQAAIAGAHEATGIPTGESMLVDNFAIELTEPAALVPGADPLDLTLETRYIGEATRSGRIRQGRVEHTIRAGGQDVGFHGMDVVFVRGSQHEALRRAQRGSVPPSTRDLVVPDPHRIVDPGKVGRVHPRNVVLSNAEAGLGTVSADVTPHPANRGLFDHTYDHLPAMTLAEAARQISFLALGSADDAHVTGIRSRFLKFAELDAPLRVSTASRGRLTGVTDLTVAFRQNDSTVAETVVTVTPSALVEENR